MKYCPNCQDFALYDDEVTYCPLCHNELRTYTFEEEEIQYQDINTNVQTQEVQRNQPFMENRQLYSLYHGSIVSIEHYHRIYPFFIKLIRSMFLNERFQFGYLSYYTNIVIEENRYDILPENQVSLTYCGDIAGRVYVGEEVDIRTKLNRHKIASITNTNTGERVNAAFSLPGWFIWLFIFTLPLIIPAIIQAFVGMFTGLLSLSLSLLEVLLYPILIIVGICYLFRSIF